MHPLAMDPIVSEAREFAVDRHGNQRRKYSEEPYVKHLDNVSEILASHGLDHPTLRAAAYLHDTIEKTATSYGDLLQRFGPEVTELVFWMTDLDIKDKERRFCFHPGVSRAHRGRPSSSSLLISSTTFLMCASTIREAHRNIAARRV